MPWDIKRRNGKYCVVKQGESSPVPGGCHDTQEKARAHQRALYASEEVAKVDGMSEAEKMMWQGIYSGSTSAPPGSFLIVPMTGTTQDFATVTVTVDDEPASEEAEGAVWEGVLGVEGLATGDRRYLIPGGISERDLPLTLMAQTQTAEGHMGAEVAGKITEIWREPRDDLGEGAVAIMGRGVFDAGEMGQEAARMVEDEVLRGVSLDLSVTAAEMLDPETLQPVDEELDMIQMLTGDFITGIRGEILGATLCAFPAFRDATVAITASGMYSEFGIKVLREVLTAAAAGMTPLHPPADWFRDPRLNGPTALEIDEDGRVFGHLALWGTCHTGFPGVCTTAPSSSTNYKMFHLGVVDTEESIPISCGQITLDTGHAPTSYGMEKTVAHYDHTGCAVCDVVCGEDAFGIWVAGAVRPGIKAETVRKLRGSKLSGDWRSVNGHLELVGILAVNVPGFPVPRTQAAIAASAAGEGEVLSLVAAGIVGDTTLRSRKRKKKMLSTRLRAALGSKETSRAELRRSAMK